MASWTDELMVRVQALAELTDDLHNRLTQVEAGLERQRAESARLAAEQKEVTAGIRFVEGRLDGKKETAALLISAFLSAMGVLVSILLSVLNRQG